MQDILERIVASSYDEVDILEELASTLSENEFYNLKKSVLSRFIQNEQILDPKIVNCHTWEISMILKMSNEPWFSQGLTSLIQEFRETIELDKDNFIKTLENSYIDIHEALNSYHDAFFLENIRKDAKLRHFARSCFRQIGDTLESTFKPYVSMIYELLKIGGKIQVITSKKQNFGDFVSSLTSIDYLENIYIDELQGISLSQWRNISQHSSYQVDENTNTITCSYANNKSKTLTPLDLEQLMFKLDEVHDFHKIAIDFIILELIHEVNLNFGLEHLSFETLIGDISSTLATYQYPVIEIIKDGEKFKFIVLDKNGGLKDGFINALQQVSAQIYMLTEKDVTPLFGLYSVSGKKIAEGKLDWPRT